MAAPRQPDLARHIEHTLLRPEATARDIERLCAEARDHRFFAVCVPGSRVVQACHCLEGSDVKVVTVAGFPFGHGDADSQRFEVEAAVDNGAHEVDVILNVGRLRDGDDAQVLRELRDNVEAADERPVKVVLATKLLTPGEIVRACRIAMESGAEFVAASTGFGADLATVEDVKGLREIVGAKFGIKAAGEIRDAQTALALIAAGANRIGTLVWARLPVTAYARGEVGT